MDIVWHGYKIFYEKNHKISLCAGIEDIPKQEFYCGYEFLEFLALNKMNGILIFLYLLDFSFLLKHQFRFQKHILGEDSLFGYQMLALAQRIVYVSHPLVYYRIRFGSLSRYELQESSQNFSSKECEEFLYDFSYSRSVFVLEMIDFLRRKEKELHPMSVYWIEQQIKYRSIGAFWMCKIKKDQKKGRKLCEEIWKYKKYCKEVEISSKIAFFFPKIYFVLKRAKEMIRDRICFMYT
ncbi:hypothetical protein [Helicobacter kayseriensis]|uniref:hypothetical protein n=1 Tax=Helicobacter kayseriensis TaxID=2905877 RepID=UPI001E3AE96D|nr:hypothetical protein [Helicobacter kayseriensis]MCE3046685.1 hypothetical protein [Helicobacter kayseriensis]MCE3048013.1 hypothetical protein [Helicobacter kayseriensis]